MCEYVIYRLGRGLLCPVVRGRHIVCTPALLSHNWLSIQKALFPPLWVQIKICPLCTNDGHLKCWALRFKTLLLTHFQTAVLSGNLLLRLCESMKSSPADSCFLWQAHSELHSLGNDGGNPTCDKTEGRGNGKSSVTSLTLSRSAEAEVVGKHLTLHLVLLKKQNKKSYANTSRICMGELRPYHWCSLHISLSTGFHLTAIEGVDLSTTCHTTVWN